MTTSSRVIMNGAPELPIIQLGAGTSGYLGSPDSFPELGVANALEDLVVLASSVDPDDEPLFFDVIWFRNGYQVPELDGESLVLSERLEPGQIWEAQVIARDPWGLSSQSSAIVEISNLPPIPSWSTIPEISISGSMITFDGSSSIDPDGTVADIGALCYDQNQNIPGCMDEEATNFDPSATWQLDGDCAYPGDFNGDGEFTVEDLLGMLADFGCTSCPQGDINGDGMVNVQDILLFLTLL